MSNRADEIKKRIAKRKRERQPLSHTSNTRYTPSLFVGDEEKFGFERLSSYDDNGNTGELHPLFRKEVFLFKILLSICVVLSIGILFKNQSAKLEPLRDYVDKTMQNDFQFAAVASWYEDTFGSPLALIPTKEKEEPKGMTVSGQYAVPATGSITQSFAVNGEGVIIETESKTVNAMSEGNVENITNNSELGKTVVIQHADGSKTWYGNLDTIEVKLYDFVRKGQTVGKVAVSEETKKGTFYFAIEQGETFIDPIQVIKFGE